MVIQTPVLLTSSGTGTDGSVFTTASVSPAGDTVLVLFVDAASVAANDNVIPTISGSLGLSWTQRVSEVNYSTTFLRGTIFTATVPSGGDNGSITITFSEDQSSCHWHLIQIAGASLTDPVVQAESAIFNTTVNPAFDLTNPPATDSLVIGGVIRNGTTGYTAGPGHTIISSQAGNSGPAIGSDLSYDMPPALQSVGFTTGSGAQKTLFGLEIAKAGDPPPPAPPAEATLVRSFTALDTVSDNTFDIPVPADIEVGETIILSLNRSTTATAYPITGVSGIGTNTWSHPTNSIRASSHIADTIVIHVTQKILSGATISVDYEAGSSNRKAAVASVWSGLVGTVEVHSGNATANGSSAAVSVSTTAATTSGKTLVIGTVGHGSGVYTPDAGQTKINSTNTTVGSSDRGVTQQYRIDEAVGVKTMSGNNASGSWAASVLAFPVASAPAGTPVAKAGGDQTSVEPWAEVTLSGSDSTADGPIESYQWVQLSGEPVTLVGTGSDRTFEAPGTIAGTTLRFRLTVTYNSMTSSDDVDIVVMKATERIVVNGVEVALKTIVL